MSYYVCISDVIWCISCNSLEPFKRCLNIYYRLMDARLIHWLRFLRENRHSGIGQRRWTRGKITFSEIFQFETSGRGSVSSEYLQENTTFARSSKSRKLKLLFINWRNRSSLVVLIIHNARNKSTRKSEFCRRGMGTESFEKGTLLSSVLFLFIHYLVNLEDVITDKFKKFEYLSKEKKKIGIYLLALNITEKVWVFFSGKNANCYVSIF